MCVLESQNKIICITCNNNFALVVCRDSMVYAFKASESFFKPHLLENFLNMDINHACSAHGYQIIASLNIHNQKDKIFQLDEHLVNELVDLDVDEKVINITCSSATTYFQLGILF